MKLLYRTKDWSGHLKHSSYWNEYRQVGDVIQKVKCGLLKSFDGKENTWSSTERILKTWHITDAAIPEWLKKHIN